MSFELFGYAFGAGAVLWIAGFGAGMATGFVQRVRSAM